MWSQVTKTPTETMSTFIKPYRFSTPFHFQIIQNKFLIINEKLFVSLTQAKQFACLGSRKKKALLLCRTFFSTRDVSLTFARTFFEQNQS
ncbi:hypothetical protein COX93_02885 [Candidatus Nomurabacteria bacterium CG_4_10_14_0_2_um_filter_30_12]|uniref:Uncharacterized protein n=3 Tax=Candidatus Nomuraibacteriota TaxID=1752729 RepID=A0A1J4UXJ9_9BACT|nr:MAG: hypothetical protein AUJ22_01100 [Candidatus Nomurabacteria bacterium CG1_02_31_12]PIR68802.1 MAG: hypothetical protein COU48_02045 [Candidatus Nomurabacteria bacterium CG10_big_fil_rev_8_21_14_0_10_03_31_7]PIZ86884.1 MAG: hypothetical protein COX93_02885 [Candidatus Nomurabacteria bacterium CG_4_10_14_0_2_um_filter_30_12]